MKVRTTVFSIVLASTEVIEIGRKSAWEVGAGTFGTGWIEACFHCRGTIPLLTCQVPKNLKDLQQQVAHRPLPFRSPKQQHLKGNRSYGFTYCSFPFWTTNEHRLSTFSASKTWHFVVSWKVIFYYVTIHPFRNSHFPDALPAYGVKARSTL